MKSERAIMPILKHCIFPLIAIAPVLLGADGMAFAPLDGFQKTSSLRIVLDGPENSEKVKRKWPLYEPSSKKIFLIERGDLVSIPAIAGDSPTRDVVLRDVYGVTFWNHDGAVCLAVSQEEDIVILTTAGEIVSRVEHHLSGAEFGPHFATSSILTLIGFQNRIQKVAWIGHDGIVHRAKTESPQTRSFVVGDAGIGIMETLSTQQVGPDQQLFPTQIFENVQDPSVEPLAMTLQPGELPLAGTVDPNKVIGVRFVARPVGPQNKQIIEFTRSPAEIRELTPESWECYDPHPCPCRSDIVAFVRSSHRINAEKNFLNVRPTGRHAVYAEAELCLSVGGDLSILSPFISPTAGDVSWSPDGSSIVFLGPTPGSKWQETESATILTFQMTP